MRFVVHIGTHKTGTSSIQTFCAANRKELLEQGIYYPTNKYSSRNFNFLAARIARGDLDEPRAFLADAARKAARKGAHTVLLSAESFYAMNSFFFRLYNRPVGNYWASEKHAVEAFRTCFPRGEMRILCYLRRQDRQVETVYNQCVKHETGFPGTIDDFLPLMEDMLDYAGHLDLWADAFGAGNIQVRSYDQAADRLIPDFLEASVGIQDDKGFRPIKEEANVRLNRDVMEYKRILNRIDMPRHEQVLHMLSLWALSQQMGDTHIHQRYLGPQERLRLVERYANGNTRVHEQFLESGAPPLFPALEAPRDVTWAPYPGLSVEKATEIFHRHKRITDSLGFRTELQLRRTTHALRQRFPAFEEVLHLVRRLRRFRTKRLA